MRNKVLIMLAVLLLTINVAHVWHSESVWGSHSIASSAIVRSIGFTGLVLSSECTSTRNPILESLCGCLGDIPGGYCYHLSCAIVGIPTATGNQPDQIATEP